MKLQSSGIAIFTSAPDIGGQLSIIDRGRHAAAIKAEVFHLGLLLLGANQATYALQPKNHSIPDARRTNHVAAFAGGL